MIRLELQIVFALLLDLLLGDPRWLPHPVRLIGQLAMALESPMRRLWRWPRLAGTATVLFVLTATAGVAWGALHLADRLHPLAGDLLAILLLWTTFAGRDLVRHSTAVLAALSTGDLALAQQRVGWIVGRDTAQLGPDGVVRAAVESVAKADLGSTSSPTRCKYMAACSSILVRSTQPPRLGSRPKKMFSATLKFSCKFNSWWINEIPAAMAARGDLKLTV